MTDNDQAGKPAQASGFNLAGVSELWKITSEMRILDDKAAAARGYESEGNTSAPHGTYTPIQYFRIHMSNKGSGANRVPRGILEIYDDHGAFCRFAWNGQNKNLETWVSQPDLVTFQVAAGEYTLSDHPVKFEAVELALYPTLVLAPYDENEAPKSTQPDSPYLRRLGDPTKKHEMDEQYLGYDGLARILTWISGGLELELQPVYQQEPMTKGEGSEKWGDIFRRQVDKYPQTTFPFYGFDPRHMANKKTGHFDLTSPGTRAAGKYKSNPNQSFNGTLIFNYPKLDSMDYNLAEDDSEAPSLPFGVTAMEIETEQEATHTQMLSSVADRVRGWSMSLGMSAGVEGMFSVSMEGSYRSKIEEQKKNESRYSVARKFGKKWVEFTDFASLSLHEDLVRNIQGALRDLQNGDEPNWAGFVNRFGTHYANAITQGYMEVMETRYSLAAESLAISEGIDLKAEAKVGIEGISASVKGSYGQEKSDKLAKEISKEDMQRFSIGKETSPMGIFYDLRPLSELFNPVFFPYNPADDWGQFAPWVWTRLRESFSRYLDMLGVGRAMDPSLETVLTPRKFAFYVPFFPTPAEIGMDWSLFLYVEFADKEKMIPVDHTQAGINRMVIMDNGIPPDDSPETLFFLTGPMNLEERDEFPFYVQFESSMRKDLLNFSTTPPSSKKEVAISANAAEMDMNQDETPNWATVRYAGYKDFDVEFYKDIMNDRQQYITVPIQLTLRSASLSTPSIVLYLEADLQQQP